MSGIKGQIVFGLCGPFTTQRALTLQKTLVNPLKVVAAFKGFWVVAEPSG
jgi:hypothetical protein